MRVCSSILAAALLMLVAGCGRPSPLVPARGELQIEINGSGAVSSDASDIDCGEDCRSTIDVGTEVELIAAPAGLHALGAWDGPCAGATGTCTFTFTGDTTITARFGYPLIVATTGAGLGFVATSGADTGITCGADCVEVYDDGASVTLVTGASDDASAFGRWLGVCSNATACVVLMKGPQAVTARFDRRGRPLTAWAWGDGNDDSVWGVDVDPASGDVLACGTYDGAIDFGAGTAVDSRARDGFVVRRTPGGALVWANVLRDPDNDAPDEVRDCLFDGQGGVAIAGRRDSNNGSGGDYDINGDLVSDVAGVATNADTVDGFVGRFFANGTLDWITTQNAGLQQTNDNGNEVEPALAAGEGDIWGGGDIFAGGNNNGYVHRYAATNGGALTQNPANETQIGGTNSQGNEVRAIARANSDDIFFTGWFDQQVTWGLEILVSGNSSRDIYIASGNGTAVPRWIVGLGGNQDDEADSIALDPTTGLIAVTGNIDEDVFVAILAQDGEVLHVERFAGPGADFGHSIAWLPDGGFVIAGEIEDGADFGLGPITTLDVDAFVARFDAAFQPVWAHRYGGVDVDLFHSIAVGPDGSIWAGGEFRDVMDTGGDPGTLTAAGNADAWVVRVLP